MESHCRSISRRPAPAQFESWDQLVGLLQRILKLIQTFRETFPKEAP